MTRSPSVSFGWTVASAGAVALVVLAVLPPVVGGEAGALVYHAFSFVCHQIPERSLHLHHGPVALCHRCLGIAGGFALGLLATPLVAFTVRQRIARGAQARWLILAGLPTAIDWLVGAVGLWANTPASRMLTGGLFGLVAGVILACNLLAPARATPSFSPALTPDA